MRIIILTGLAAVGLAAGELRADAADTARAQAPSAIGTAVAAPAFQQLDQEDYYGERRASQYAPGVRVWLDNDRDLLRLGERARVLVRATEDAYLAVIHIDTNGDVEFLYPSSPYDDGYVRGGRTFSVPSRGAGWLNVSGGYGIGYVFAIASQEPLDYRRFRDSWYRGARWDRNRNVYGDPFLAMERFERSLVRDWDYGYHDTDYYSYHVGRRYTSPRYACYDDYGSWYHSRSTYWSSCDRVRVLLVNRPYYYDTRYYRGDRGVYYRRSYGDPYAGRRTPSHGYKDGGQGSSVPPLRRQGARPAEDTRTDVGGSFTRPESDRGEQQEPRARQPERSRPTFGRRTSEPQEAPARRDEPRRESPPAERRSSPPAERRASPPAERRAAPAERRSEPRREAAPRARSSGERSAPRARPN